MKPLDAKILRLVAAAAANTTMTPEAISRQFGVAVEKCREIARAVRK